MQILKSKNVLNGLWSKIGQKDSHKLYTVDVGVAKCCLNSGDSYSPKMLQKPPKNSEIVLQKFVNILHLPFTKFIVIATFIAHIIVSLGKTDLFSLFFFIYVEVNSRDSSIPID